jgi:hypothetical protein
MRILNYLSVIAVLGLVDCSSQPPRAGNSAPALVRPAAPVAPPVQAAATPADRDLFARALDKTMLRNGISAEVTTTIGAQDVLMISYELADRAWAFNFTEELVKSAPFRAAGFRGIIIYRGATFWAYDAAGNQTTTAALLDPILQKSSPRQSRSKSRPSAAPR